MCVQCAYLLGGRALKGRSAREHLVQQDAERPPIGRAGATTTADHLGRCVLVGAALGEGARRRGLLGEAEIADLDVAVGVDEHVLELDVAVDPAVGVHVAQRQSDARAVEARLVLGQSVGLRVEEAKEVPARSELEAKKEGRVVLEGGEAVGDKGMMANVMEALTLRQRPGHRLLRQHR